MSAVDWAATVTLLDAALASAVGVDLELGTPIRAELAALGALYAVAYDSAADDAKDVWLARAESAHDEADEAARYLLSLVDDAPTALTFDPYSSALISARCIAAAAVASDDFASEAIVAHRRAVEALFNVSSAELKSDPDLASYWGDEVTARWEGRVLQRVPSVREREIEIMAVIAEATSWLALVAYPP